MLKFLETTKSEDYPCHTYFLESDKRTCYGYIKKGTKKPIMFVKPMRFDPKNRTFKEIKS